MPADIISLDAKELYGDLHDFDQFMGMKDGYENFYRFPCEICNGFCYLVKFKPGLILAITKQRSTKPFLVNYQDQSNRFVISFTLAGDHTSSASPIVHNKRPRPYTSRLSDSYMTYSPECSGVLEYPQATDFCCICIILEPWLMNQFRDDCDDCIFQNVNSTLGGCPPTHYYQRPLTITPVIGLRLHEIMNCRYQGNTRRYFFESKVLEILVHIFEQLKSSITRNRDPFSLNDGFEDFVVRARDLLMSRRLTVTQVALEAGYTHHSSFTKEFKKYFGESPTGYLA